MLMLSVSLEIYLEITKPIKLILLAIMEAGDTRLFQLLGCCKEFTISIDELVWSLQ